MQEDLRGVGILNMYLDRYFIGVYGHNLFQRNIPDMVFGCYGHILEVVFLGVMGGIWFPEELITLLAACPAHTYL